MRISGIAPVLSLIAVAVMAAASLYAWSALPPGTLLPMGWSADGEPVRKAEPWLALGILPALALFLTAIFSLIPGIEPRRENLARSAFAFRFIWIAIIGTLMLLHFAYISDAVFGALEFAALRSAIIGALFMALGFVLPGVKSNFFLGVRTPWTLSSDAVWEKTHRAAGPVVFLFGLALVIAAFLAPELWTRILLFGGVTIAVFLVLFSLFVWMREKSRQGEG